MAAAVEPSNIQLSYLDVDRTAQRVMAPAGLKYWLWVAFCAFLVALGGAFWTRQIYEGLGVTGYGQPTLWAVYITDFVFWVGIAHSGTLISAVLFLFRTRWRTAVYRCAETMTIFAVVTAGLFPIVHLGRPWFFYWLCPYPNERFLQPDFRSPLTWDFFAISTYLTTSTLFLSVGLIPDIANMRDISIGWRKKFYTILSCGWQGTDSQWRNFSMAYLLLAGFATPLVLSVHSVVSWDFATMQTPGMHSTIFAPYFVCGAIFSGCAMVLTLLLPMRKWLQIEDLVTVWHLDNLAKVILFTSLVMTYSYGTEAFVVWYTQDPIEIMTFTQRFFGLQGYLAIGMILCNCVIPLILFSPRARSNTVILFIISIFVNIGMWLERFVLIAGSLATAQMPSQWKFYVPKLTEVLITVGSFGWFLMNFSIFTKFLPIVSMTELKEGITWLRKAGRERHPYRKAA
ncbi:MAG TPA: NrfD/PsrC family molybdoenzyme membrane anchor subunit [Candidatus Binataceae bacterium]|nr:NrfD/PsrC family molybdoenzyme membrane anchor subunit [Candidatus Binataceae bacterium]